MNLRLFHVLATVIAVSAGVITLLGYFLQEDVASLLTVRLGILWLASLLAAWAVWAGALNLLVVHTKRFINQAPGWLYSVFVVIGFALVVVANLLTPFMRWGAGPAGEANRWIFDTFISAGGAALSGLIAFFLVLAGYRLLGRRPSPIVIVFVGAAVITLAGMAPLPAGFPDPAVDGQSLRAMVWIWLSQVPAVAGARGLLLGVALGAVATGLRVLLALDRPYGD